MIPILLVHIYALEEQVSFDHIELKVEHNGSHAAFIDVDISIDERKFIYKMLDKRETFNFYIARMPSIQVIYHLSFVIVSLRQSLQ